MVGEVHGSGVGAMTDEYAVHVLEPKISLFRIYYRDINEGPGSPAWFCDGVKYVCRFDLAGEAGTCYTSSSPEGAFIEVFLRVAGKGVPQDQVDQRFLACMHVTHQQDMLDLNVNANLGVMGIDAYLVHEMDEQYPRSRELAQRIREQRLGGVKWNGLRDLTGTRVNFAVFSEFSGDQEAKLLDVEAHGPIPDDLVASMVAEFGGGSLGSSSLYPLKP